MLELHQSDLLNLSHSYQQKSKNDSKHNNKSSGRWTKEEHQRFVDGLKKFGKNWKQVEEYVATRSGAQIRSHAQKFFNRLERDFNVKLDDFSGQSSKDKLDQTMLKMTEHHEKSSAKVQKTRRFSEKTVCSSPEEQSSSNSKMISSLNSPKLSHIENQTAKKAVEEIKSYSFFDIIMSKIKSSNNTIMSPKLSDLVDLSSSSTRASFDQVNASKGTEVITQIVQMQNLLNSSFKIHPRKMSEDNLVKLSQLRRPDDAVFSDVELLVKKNKT